MKVFVFAKSETSLKNVFPQNTKVVSVPQLKEFTPENDSMFYFDVGGFSDEEIKKNLTVIKNICKDSCWGIIDFKGNVKDSSALFFQGASDYLGPLFLKEPLRDSKRLKEALAWRRSIRAPKIASETKESETSGAEAGGSASFLKAGIKLPSENLFPGWKKMQTGKNMPFYFLYCSLQGKFPLDTRFDSKTIALIHKRFLSHLEDNFNEGDGLLWMNSGKDCLFLVPPKAKCIEAVIKSCIDMTASAPLIVLETLGLSFPANFTFALHYGSVNYNPPGKTGTVVSDAVNFIFHLGTKKAEYGRLTVSGELPDKTIPPSLLDCFVSAGEFEGRKIWHTKKFSYVKLWL